MTTYTLPESLSARIGTEIATYIEHYVPTTLTEAQWRLAQPGVCEMTARTEPTSCADAGTVLSALCRFLSWGDTLTASLQLDSVLTAPLVERFAEELKGEISEGGRDNHRGVSAGACG